MNLLAKVLFLLSLTKSINFDLLKSIPNWVCLWCLIFYNFLRWAWWILENKKFNTVYVRWSARRPECAYSRGSFTINYIYNAYLLYINIMQFYLFICFAFKLQFEITYLKINSLKVAWAEFDSYYYSSYLISYLLLTKIYL